MESSKFQFEEASWASRFQESVWHEFSGLARKYGAVNLGQGFPNFPPPDFVAESVTKALTTPVPSSSSFVVVYLSVPSFKETAASQSLFFLSLFLSFFFSFLFSFFTTREI